MVVNLPGSYAKKKEGGTSKGNSIIINYLLYCNACVSANERRTSTLLFLSHSIKATSRNTQLSTLRFSHSHPNPFSTLRVSFDCTLQATTVILHQYMHTHTFALHNQCCLIQYLSPRESKFIYKM